MLQVSETNLQLKEKPLSNPTLYATVIKLCALADGSLPETQGRLAHGAFLDLIRAVDPALSAALHTPNQRRPFTISPLQRTRQPHNGQVRVRAGDSVWLRFTLLNSEMFATFTRYLLAPPRQNPDGLPTLRLAEVDFAITEMLTTPGSDPWAGYTTVSELCQRWHTASLQKADYKISLELASGSVFSPSGDKAGMGKFMEVLPTPEMVFGSLAAAWNERTGLTLDSKAIREYARETVVVSAYKLETQLFHYWGNPQVGAIGRVAYQLKSVDTPEMARALNLLADFAFYSGIGAKTALGMGMARRREEH